MRRRWAHLGLAAVGLLAVVWALWWGANPAITCHDQPMQPGDSCVHATSGASQTWQQRYDAAQDARPVVAAVGVAVLGFAGFLWFSDSRRGKGVAEPRPAEPDQS